MTNDIDENLKRLTAAPVSGRLAGLEDSVLERVAGYNFAAHELPMRFRVAAIAAALVLGVVGGMVPTERAEAVGPLSPFGATQFAPSALLAPLR